MCSILKTYHEVAKDECGQKDNHADLSIGTHTVPQRLNPLSTEHTEYQEQRMEKVIKIPPEEFECKAENVKL